MVRLVAPSPSVGLWAVCMSVQSVCDTGARPNHEDHVPPKYYAFGSRGIKEVYYISFIILIIMYTKFQHLVRRSESEIELELSVRSE